MAVKGSKTISIGSLIVAFYVNSVLKRQHDNIVIEFLRDGHYLAIQRKIGLVPYIVALASSKILRLRLLNFDSECAPESWMMKQEYCIVNRHSNMSIAITS